MRAPRIRHAVLAAAAAALTVVLSACSVAPSGSGGSAASGDRPTLRVAYQSFTAGDVLVKNKSWLEEALPGYDVRWTKFDSGADVNTAFQSGQIDFAAIGSSPIARGLSEPLSIPYQVALVLEVNGDNEALVARADTRVTDVAGLRGKRIATPFASTAHFSLLAALQQVGIGPSDVTLVDLAPQAALAAWQRGDIDAVYVWTPTLDELRRTGNTLVTSGQLAAAGKPTSYLGVVASGFATAHPDVVDVWRTQQLRAIELLRTDPSGSAAAVAAEIGTTPQDAASQLSQGVFLTPEQQTSAEWLGTEGRPGGVAAQLRAEAAFLAEQKQIPAAGDLASYQDALYLEGLSGGPAQ